LIYIVTPVFNRKTFTKNYLEALNQQTNKNFKVIIVDDGSTDGTDVMIEECFPDVILLKEKGNLWWAGATNVGVRYAIEQGADYVMTLNDDTVPLSDYVENMIAWSKKEPSALLGALAIDYDTCNVVYGGGNHNWKSGQTMQLLDVLSIEEQKGLHSVNFFPGRGLLIPVTVFEQVGFYDSENFPQTVADYDFTYRVISHGFKIYCNYDARIKIFPNESATNKLRDKKSLKNYYSHLFFLRGGGNLKFFTKVAIKNCPKRYLFQYLFLGVSRRMLGYLKDWVIK
jgi:GT2 family glycosyltransferase